jgi:hypothetical protein
MLVNDDKKWRLHPDLGIYMGRNSVMNSYMMNILGAVCGFFGVSGGNVIPGMEQGQTGLYGLCKPCGCRGNEA